MHIDFVELPMFFYGIMEKDFINTRKNAHALQRVKSILILLSLYGLVKVKFHCENSLGYIIF